MTTNNMVKTIKTIKIPLKHLARTYKVRGKDALTLVQRQL